MEGPVIMVQTITVADLPVAAAGGRERYHGRHIRPRHAGACRDCGSVSGTEPARDMLTGERAGWQCSAEQACMLRRFAA